MCLQRRRPGFDPWVGKMPWRRESHPLQYSHLEYPRGEPGWLQSTVLQRAGNDRAANTFTFKAIKIEKNFKRWVKTNMFMVLKARKILQKVFGNVSENFFSLLCSDLTSACSKQLSSQRKKKKSILGWISKGAYLPLKLLSNCIQNHLMMRKYKKLLSSTFQQVQDIFAAFNKDNNKLKTYEIWLKLVTDKWLHLWQTPLGYLARWPIHSLLWELTSCPQEVQGSHLLPGTEFFHTF